MLRRLVALGLVAPFVIYPVFLMKVLCFALFACAFNLLIGYVGLLSFGHAMFFGFAAYISGIHGEGVGLAAGTGASSPATGVAAALGLMVGAIAIRRQGIYFAMVTLALAQMVFFFCLQAQVHRRRGRHPGHPAPAAVRHARSRPTTSYSTTSCWRSSASAS